MTSLKLLLRFLTVGGLVLLLLIPLMLIRGMVTDRQHYRQQASERVSQSMAGPQQFIGPLRVVPYTETRLIDVATDSGKTVKKTETVAGYLYQTPKDLRIQGGLKPDTRRIGLYAVRVFEWQAAVSAGFEPLELAPVEGRVYGAPTLVIGLADVRGLVGSPDFKVDGQSVTLESGTGSLEGKMSGMHAGLPQAAGVSLPASQLVAHFRLNGTQSLGVTPIADNNQITVGSAWPHPLFGGSFLPNRKELRSDGFSANWEISSLASSAQSQLSEHLSNGSGSISRRSLGSGYDNDGKVVANAEESAASGLDSIDVSLVDTTDIYTQVDRASKYGLLFVVLTFVGFALFELIKRLPIHPLQYLLVGLALAIFFLLLLSLSEHIDFMKAYVISAVACIGLQFFYLSGVLKSWARAAGFALMLTALYSVLYSLLASEDNALLMGSLLLFGILAAIMWITRKVDWYELGSSLR